MAKEPKKDNSEQKGIIYEFVLRVRLILVLMRDRRVFILLKLIPLVGVVYVISPFDLPTPIDDLFVLFMACWIFIEACPPEIVKEHLFNLRHLRAGQRYRPTYDPNIIDGIYRNIGDEDEEPKSENESVDKS